MHTVMMTFELKDMFDRNSWFGKRINCLFARLVCVFDEVKLDLCFVLFTLPCVACVNTNSANSQELILVIHSINVVNLFLLFADIICGQCAK